MIRFKNIQEIASKQLTGMNEKMSFAQNTTLQLWQRFMPRRKEIQHTVGNNLYSLQIYPEGFFNLFDPMRSFGKWALIEVSSFEMTPQGMSCFTLPAGTYAVFDYKGTQAEAAPAYRYIFSEWLPSSSYVLDTRPHFEILGEKYKLNDPDSEEEIWIPVKKKP